MNFHRHRPSPATAPSHLLQVAECEADCSAALEGGAALATRAHAKLLLRRAEARRLRGGLDEAGADLRAAAALPLDSATRALLGAAEATLEQQLHGPAEEAAAATGAAATSPTSPTSPPAPAAAAGKVPVHEVSVVTDAAGGGRSVSILVELPEVQKLAQISLELSEGGIKLDGCGYALDAPLPLRIDPDRAAAKFSAKSQRLKITVPEA